MGVPESQFRPGVLVPEVSRGSPAAAAGVRAGDVILGIGGLELTGNPAAVQRAVRYILCALCPPRYCGTVVLEHCLLLIKPCLGQHCTGAGRRHGSCKAHDLAYVAHRCMHGCCMCRVQIERSRRLGAHHTTPNPGKNTKKTLSKTPC